MMDPIKASGIKRKVSRGTATLLLSVAMIATAWGQQGGQGASGGPGGMPLGMPGPGSNVRINYTSAIYVNDGVYLPEKSTATAVSGGKVRDTSASRIKITSKADDFNGLYVKGSKSVYTLSNATIDLYGNGSNDFYGVGAGAMADEGATLVLRNVLITTNGVISPTTTSTGNSTLKVYDSTLRANGGTLPKGYVRKIGPGMMEPPAPLGISGTARATLTMNNSKSYFYNTTIIADGWGALSTDAAWGVYLEANHCDVQVLKSGYGTYADNGAKVVINDSKMTTATYQGIVAGQASLAFNHVTGSSDGNSVMIHSVMGRAAEVGTLEIMGGKIATRKAVILVKSANADITIDGAELSSKSGALLQSVISDDANATKVNGQQVVGIKATLKKMTLEGNILHEDTERGMSVTFISTTLKGSIKGASVSLDAGSKWTATENSIVTLVDSVDVATIDAPTGVTITAVAGKGCTLKGTYKLAGGGIVNVKAI